MNQIVLIVLLLLADDSTLVKAAKANGGLKKPIPKKTITNKDVKASKGTITVLPPTVAPASAGAGQAEARPTSVLEFEAHKKAVAAAEKRVAESELTVSDLEKELARVEQSYYESADLNYRDTAITARFDQTKKQLEAARKHLADARDALATLLPKPPAPETPNPQ